MTIWQRLYRWFTGPRDGRIDHIGLRRALEESGYEPSSWRYPKVRKPIVRRRPKDGFERYADADRVVQLSKRRAS